MIEALQTRALKIVYGRDELLKKADLVTLEERRVILTDKFATALQQNPRFAYLFPLRPQQQLRARNAKPFLEEKASSARLYNSPLYYWRRRLNQMSILQT